MFHIALYEPEIPPNTGNIARLCAATFTPLHIVGVTGFQNGRQTLRRSGLDYWDEVKLHRHLDLAELIQSLPESRFLYFTTKAKRHTPIGITARATASYSARNTRAARKRPERKCGRCLTIPMPNSRVRSLNLSTSVGIVLYEAIRQLDSSNKVSYKSF